MRIYLYLLSECLQSQCFTQKLYVPPRFVTLKHNLYPQRNVFATLPIPNEYTILQAQCRKQHPIICSMLCAYTVVLLCGSSSIMITISITHNSFRFLYNTELPNLTSFHVSLHFQIQWVSSKAQMLFSGLCSLKHFTAEQGIRLQQL